MNSILSTDPRWKPDNHECKLLEFLESLIIDLAESLPAITQQDVAGWLASVVVGRARRVYR